MVGGRKWVWTSTGLARLTCLARYSAFARVCIRQTDEVGAPGSCAGRAATHSLCPMRRIILAGTAIAGVRSFYELVARGWLTLDLGIGRRVRPLGPTTRTIAAPPELVFDIIAGPYLGRTPRAMQDTLRVWERGEDMVLAEHRTTTGRLVTTTVETVRFERPNRITFRLVRGPVPHVAETFELRAVADGTAFTYSGELGTDLWQLGRWWGDRVAGAWQDAVARSLESVQAEAERRHGSTSPRRIA
jgi:hypothetical protein